MSVTYDIPNGLFVFRMQIVNELGTWSEWGSTHAKIDAPKRMDIILDGNAIAYGAELKFDVDMR